MKRIEVDRDRCEGHGMCEQVAPDIYTVNDDGMVETVVGELSGAQVAPAEAGARVCPVAALKVVDA